MRHYTYQHRTGRVERTPTGRYVPLALVAALWCAWFPLRSAAQTNEAPESVVELKRLSIEELMNAEVTSVSKRPEKLSDSPSAIQVITSEDIRRSGATRLPEALRLASNLEVAEIDPGQWAISARGFNSPLADKMLVLVDGRTIYSPLFSGVFWSLQEVFLEDVDRIEVISGPGGALWGANAVNGVINVSSKNSKDTQGLLLEGGGGSETEAFGGVRYGGTLASNLFFRVYGKYVSRDNLDFANGVEATNNWDIGQAGFRMDWEPSDANLFTLQADLYQSDLAQVGTNDVIGVGGNVLGRWTHTISDRSDVQLQAYYDRVHLDDPGGYNDWLDTYDVDFQHRFPLGGRNDIVWGLGYRLVNDDFQPGPTVLTPPKITMPTYSGFVQDEITLIEDRLHLTLGSKLEHDYYTGYEVEPSVRLAYTPGERQLFWGAISRAVRTPARIDRDLDIPPTSTGSPDDISEVLLAYELGYRVHPTDRFSVSLAGYLNEYSDIRSIEFVGLPNDLFEFENGQKGQSWGAELASDYQATPWWHLHAGYTELQLQIWRTPGSTDFSEGAAEAADPRHQVFLRSYMNLPAHIEFDPSFRYISAIDNPREGVPGYAEMDLRIAWEPRPNLEFSIVGQNLLHDHHAEFNPVATRQEIPRSIFGKITWRF